MNSNDNNLHLPFLTLSLDYLHTTENILEQMINSGNQWMIIGDRDNKESIESRSKKYNESTKWSDFNVILPMLFLFYHGIETLLKSLVFLKDSNDDSIKKLRHNLEELFNVTKINYPKLLFMEPLEKYLIYSEQTPLILREFIDSNGDIKDMNDLYSVLRYPTDILGRKDYNYLKLRHREKEGLLFIQELKELIKNICLQSVEESRKNEK